MDSFLTEGKKDLQYSVQFSIASRTNKNHSFAFGATKKRKEKNQPSYFHFLTQIPYFIHQRRKAYLHTYIQSYIKDCIKTQGDDVEHLYGSGFFASHIFPTFQRKSSSSNKNLSDFGDFYKANY